MDVTNMLNKKDMEKVRTAKDFYIWMINKNKELSSSPEAKTFARSGSQLSKKFYNEIHPLAIFVNKEYKDNNNVLVQPNLGSDNFDAKIINQDDTKYVEITYAKDGYVESLRDELLEKDGHAAPLTGPIKATGRPGTDNRIVTATSESVNRREQTEEYTQIIENAVNKKANKTYGSNHILLVAVQDHLALADNSYWDIFDSKVKKWLKNPALDFGRVVFIGVTQRFFRSYELPITDG